MTPTQRKRLNDIERARELLATGATILSVAKTIGRCDCWVTRNCAWEIEARRNEEIARARLLIEAGNSIAETARKIDRSCSFVSNHAREQIDAKAGTTKATKRRRAKKQNAALSRLKPAPKNYQPTPSSEMPNITDGRDVADALAWWQGATNA